MSGYGQGGQGQWGQGSQGPWGQSGHGQWGQGSSSGQHGQGLEWGRGGQSMQGTASGFYGGQGSEQGQRGMSGSQMWSGGRSMFGNERRGGKAPKGYVRSDERLKEMICERLMQDGNIDASDVEIRVASGLVTLEGSVDSRMAKYQIEDIDRGHWRLGRAEQPACLSR